MTKAQTTKKTKAILDRQEKAFRGLVVFALIEQSGGVSQGESVGVITARYPKDGAGVLRVWVQLPLIPPIEGTAGGGGYNKMQAALYDAGESLGRELLYIRQLESDYMAKGESGKCEAARLNRARLNGEAIQAALVDQTNGESDLTARLAAQKINLIRVV